MPDNHLKWYSKALHQYLNSDEIKMLMEKSDLKATLEILHTWAWIAFAFFLSGMWPNTFTIIVSLFILGGKQLACAIILHDCSHESMFKSRAVNRFAGNWFGAFPIFHDIDKYRPYHIQHHINTGLETDPDKPLTTGYPTTRWSMVRKFLRDFFGPTGVKSNAAVLLMQLGVLKYSLNGRAELVNLKGKTATELVGAAVRNLAGPVAVNLILLAILYAFGQSWLYLLWIGALLTTNNFSLRVRSMAEHSMVDDSTNPHKNTRTTYANFFERILFAPHYVNYHAEHHLCMGAPSYNLPAMHRLLLQRGYFKEGVLAHNYTEIVKQAVAG